jgi:hypothetical protein
MRTDPRAAEVRSIVGRIFAGFLAENEHFERPALRVSNRTRKVNKASDRKTVHSSSGVALATEPDATAFPRLYQPDSDWAESADEQKEMETPEIDEKILIDRGRYVARTYRAAGLMAMWLVGVGIVQFYDDSGRMLGTINLFRTLPPKRMAS